MIVPLIPLFLAASINVTERGDWKYGPEVIYNARIDGESPSLDSSGRTVIFNTTVKIACRPKSELTLICTFNKPTVVLTLWKTVEGHRVFENTEEYREVYPDINIFEMDFDKNNSKPLSLTASGAWEKMNFIKALASELYVVANFTTQTGKTFEIVNTSMATGCRVKYVRTTTKVAEDDAKNTEKNGRVSMIILPGANVLKGEIQEIHKETDVNSRGYRPLTELGVTRRLISSKGRMTVSESNFTSYTDNKAVFSDEQVQFVARERITMTLDEVVPAGGPLPKIIEPRTHNLQIVGAFTSDSIDIGYGTKLYDDWLALIDDKDNKSNVTDKNTIL